MDLKKIFNGKCGPHGTVTLNWHNTPEKEFTYFAEAYHKVAKTTVQGLKNDPKFGLYSSPLDDFLTYPVIFLYRHALELYMKAVIMTGSPMLRLKNMGQINRKKLLKTHNLDSLSQKLEQIFKAFEWDWDLGIEHFRTIQDFRRVISELHEVDKGSDTFRYPLDTKGNASLAPYFRFNLFDFCEVLDDLFPVFEGVARLAYDMLQQTNEIMTEAHEMELDNSDNQRDID